MAAEAKEAEETLPEGMAVLDFDMLCAAVALQTQGVTSVDKGSEGHGGRFGGVQRMWEGEILDCFEDPRIAIESACCPFYRFGKNMRRASLGPCFLQGSIYFLLVVTVLFNFIAFGVTKQHCYLYMGAASAASFGLYVGYFRTRIRKRFNIGGRDSSLDGCIQHLICPCCTLCQGRMRYIKTVLYAINMYKCICIHYGLDNLTKRKLVGVEDTRDEQRPGWCLAWQKVTQSAWEVLAKGARSSLLFRRRL